MCWRSVHVSCTAEHQSKLLLAQSAQHCSNVKRNLSLKGSVLSLCDVKEKALKRPEYCCLWFCLNILLYTLDQKLQTKTFSGRLLSHETERHKTWKQGWGYNWKEVASLLLRVSCVDQQMALDSFIQFCALVFLFLDRWCLNGELMCSTASSQWRWETLYNSVLHQSTSISHQG